MSNHILLSVKPAFAELLVCGLKKVELRRSFPKSAIGKKCYIYSSSPTQAIIGECEISEIHECSIEELWREYSESSCIGWKHFKEYFEGKESGFAISMIKHQTYEHPISLKNKFDLVRPPQSFCYV